LLYPEDGGDTLLCNVGEFLQNCTQQIIFFIITAVIKEIKGKAIPVTGRGGP
jgi:hypothetical protein